MVPYNANKTKDATSILVDGKEQTNTMAHAVSGTGNAGQAVAGGLNPWATQLIKKETTDASGNVDVATNAMAHAVWGAVSSQMSGGRTGGRHGGQQQCCGDERRDCG